MATIRYLVSDIDRAIVFYTQKLGFRLKQQISGARERNFEQMIDIMDPFTGLSRYLYLQENYPNGRTDNQTLRHTSGNVLNAEGH